MSVGAIKQGVKWNIKRIGMVLPVLFWGPVFGYGRSCGIILFRNVNKLRFGIVCLE